MESGAENEREKARERQRIIRQINPHFIFNTLAAIRIVTKVNADLAYDLIYDFSKYLRAVFKSFTNPENIPFTEEIENVVTYVNLEKIRFGDRITLNLLLEEDNFVIPPLSLQPLVENAIKHGLKNGREKGSISILSYNAPSEYIVRVEDNGAGFDAGAYDAVKENGELADGGLFRVKCQIESMGKGRMEIQSSIGAGTAVTLHIPKIKA